MKTIWKFPLAVDGFQKIDMPKGAEVLTVQTQGERACLWVKLDPSADGGSPLASAMPLLGSERTDLSVVLGMSRPISGWGKEEKEMKKVFMRAGFVGRGEP